MKKILIVTGEPSGDLHGGRLIVELLKREKNLKVFAVGGPAIQAAGGAMIFDIESLGVVGLFEVVTHLKSIRKAFRAVLHTLMTESIDQLILIDYPDFNLTVAQKAKKMGIPVSYYISPQIWAWRYGRIHLIKKLVDQMLVILPFEEKIYQTENIPVEFVGHPLLEEIAPIYDKNFICSQYRLNPDHPIVGICPGSRRSELDRLLPVMAEASAKIKEKMKQIQFVLPVASTFSKEEIFDRLGPWSSQITPVKGNTSEAMAVCDLLIVASGTATLQAAIIGIPMVVVYKVSPLTYLIGKMLLKIKTIGLVNIILDDTIVPELIQNEATPDNICLKTMDLLENKDKRSEIKKKLLLIRQKLGEKRASEKAAEAILRLLEKVR